MTLANKVRAMRLVLQGGQRHVLFALTCCATLSICLLVASVLLDSYQDIGRDVAVSASNLAAAAAHDIDGNIEHVDAAIHSVATALTKPAILALAPADRDMVLFAASTTVAGLGPIIVLDDKGFIRTTSRPLVSHFTFLGDRDYFRVHIASDVGLYVSKPFVSRISGVWMVALSRRITNADGSFGGVVLSTIDLAYLNQLYEGLDLGRDGSVTLFRTDGTIVTRAPYTDGDAGRFLGASDGFHAIRALRRGSLEGVSPIDGRRRIISYHRVGHLPLIQDVEISTDEAYAGWWRKTMVIGGVLGIMALSSLGLIVLLNAELERRIVMEAELARMARTDDMTGLSNRRRFVEVLKSLWTTAQREGTCMSLLMIDADRFKAYNDAFGHPAGDALLKWFASCLTKSVSRPDVLACRYGGEEFTILLPDTNAEEALNIAERIRASIMDLGKPHPALPERVATVSIGVATMRPGAGEDGANLIAAADAALYRAKAEGRNRSRAATIPLTEDLAAA